VPWLIAGWIYLRGLGAVSDPRPDDAVAPSAAATRRDTGPWGRLDVAPIVISPPIEYVSTTWDAPRSPLWYFPGATETEVRRFLSTAGLTTDDLARLRPGVRPEPRIQGVTVAPDPAWLRGLRADVRGRIYRQLGRTALNSDQLEAYRYYGATPDEWLGFSPLSAETRQLVDPLIYSDGGFLYFADLELIRPLVTDSKQLQRLVKALLRQATLEVRLRIEDPADVNAIAEYWGRGGRRTDVRPLLESVADGGPQRSIDISHLLPALAREHLYRYPRVAAADLQRPLLANCLWTALNFFNARPDDRFLDEQVGLDSLKRDYYIVQDGLQLGDIAAFFDGGGNLFHVAVYLADGLVFGKNGASRLAPWTILPIERLKGHYPEYADDWHVTFHRRNDL
jgi:hypothetical protein